MVWQNLKNSFPEKSDIELYNISKDFYKNLCDYAVETLKLLTISPLELQRRVMFMNPEVANNYFSNNQSVFFLAAHLFNWEWLLTTGSIIFPATDFVYQPVQNAFFQRLMLTSRSRFGAHAIKRDEVAREALKRRNITRGVAVVADQYPGYGHDKKYVTKFLNQETVFFFGTNQIAQLLQYPALLLHIEKKKRGFYTVNIIEIAMPPYQKEGNVVIENYVREVERVIKENPAMWLWSHNRWKTRHLKQTSV